MYIRIALAFLLAQACAPQVSLAQVSGQNAKQPSANQGPNPSANPNARPPEKCSVTGKAVHAVTGEPLKKTHVMLQGSTPDNFSVRSSVMTEADGIFTLTDVEPGTYRLTANRSGFAATAYGAKKLSTMGMDLKLAAGQTVNDIVLRLQPQGVVTGKITDTDGDPVANVTVSLVRSFYRNGERTLLDAASSNTNDLGEYRIFGVQAGKYRLRATFRIDTFNNPGEQEDYAPGYYPGQPNPSAAALLELQPGQTLAGVDMPVLRTPTRRVRGKVLITSARPDNIQVTVASRDQEFAFNMRRGTTVPASRPGFEFRLPPGSYTITAYYNDGAGMVSGATPVDVGNSDLDNVAIAVQRGADIAGRLRIEGANDLKALGQSTVRINVFPKDNTGISSAIRRRV